MGIFKKNISGMEWSELLARVDRLESKVFKNKRPTTTLGQQILMLHHLGMLEPLYSLFPTNLSRAKILAILLNGDESNAKKFLEALPHKEEDVLKISFNYKVLRQTFEIVGQEELEEKINTILNTLEDGQKSK